MKTNIMILISLLLVGCVLPETGVHTGSPRPTIYLEGNVDGADIYVDGLRVGSANMYDGNPKVLVVEEGAHIVEIRKGNLVIHTEKTFVSNGESKKIIINAGGK